MGQLELHTDDLTLRTVSMKELAEVVRTWDLIEGGISRGQARGIIRRMRRSHRRNRIGRLEHLCLAVFEKGKGEIIGWCGLDGRCVPGRTVIFYLIARAYRGRGYATQCARRLIAYAFEDAGLRRVDGGCAKDNAASRRVMEKAGMVLVGTEENGDFQFCVERRKSR